MKMPKKFHGKPQKPSHKNVYIPPAEKKSEDVAVVIRRKAKWSSVFSLLRDFKDIT